MACKSSSTAAGRGDVGGIRRGHETRAFSDDETGARTMRSAALGRSNDVLAARRSLAVAVSAQESRRGGWQSSRKAAGRGDVGGIRRGHETRAFSDDETGARTTRSAALGRGNDALAARRSLAVAVSAQESRRGGWQSSRKAAGRGDVGGIRRGHETRAFSDDETGARTTRSAALGRSNDVLAARRSLAVAVSAQESRRGGWQSSRTAAGRGDVGGIRRGHETRAFSDDETGARTTRSAALGRSNDVLAARRSLAVAVSAQESRRGGWQSSRTAAGRGGVGGIRRGHETRAFSDDETGARTTRSAALGRSNDVLAARRSLAVVVSAQESRRGGWQSSRTAAGRGDVGGIRRGHETRAFSDDETGARTTRSAALGRSNDVLAARRSLAVVVSAREPARWLARAAERPRGAVASAEFGGVTRPARFSTTRPAHARRGRRRSVAATTCSRRGARSLSSCRLESRRGGLQEQQNGRRAR